MEQDSAQFSLFSNDAFEASSAPSAPSKSTVRPVLQFDLFPLEEPSDSLLPYPRPYAEDSDPNDIKGTFCSGMSSITDLKAAIAGDFDYGVSLYDISEPALDELYWGVWKEGSTARIFVDSGAFGCFQDGIPVDYDKALEKYNWLSRTPQYFSSLSQEDIQQRKRKALSRLYFCGPDVIADQASTLSMVAKYRDKVMAMMAKGINVIQPLQNGDLSPSRMLDEVKSIYQTEKFICGIPSVSGALDGKYIRDVRHHSFHILGVGTWGSKLQERLRDLHQFGADVSFTCDATLLRNNRYQKIASQKHKEVYEALALAHDPIEYRDNFEDSCYEGLADAIDKISEKGNSDLLLKMASILGWPIKGDKEADQVRAVRSILNDIKTALENETDSFSQLFQEEEPLHERFLEFMCSDWGRQILNEALDSCAARELSKEGRKSSILHVYPIIKGNNPHMD